MPELSLLIPSRNEDYLQNTIDDIFKHSEADIEVIVGLDGLDKSIFTINKHPERFKRLFVWDLDNPIGQRAMTNLLANHARGKYIAKIDSHCSFAQGFDRILLESMEEDMIVTPILARLHAFDWVCSCGKRENQDTPFKCHDVKKETVWEILSKPFTNRYGFDSNFIFQYLPNEEGKLVETMALQGSFFMILKDKYFELNICDEAMGSWGFQGIETACKGWFNNMRVVTNKDTYYAHYFKEKIIDGKVVVDISYNRPQKEIDFAHKKIKEMFDSKDIAWLVKKFDYPCDWDKKKVRELLTKQ